MRRQICQQCTRPLSVCFCHCLTHINNPWPIWILQHEKEKKHAIGTVKIAQLSLSNITSFTTKASIENTAFQSSIKDLNPVLVYPNDNAITLSQFKVQAVQDNKLNQTNPSPLLFLDGSWRKTYKMFFEYPELKKLRCVSINPDNISNYRIRKEPSETSISTLEAIVHVLSTLDNNTKKYQPLLDTMNWMIDKQIEYMGKDVYEKNYINKKRPLREK